MSKAQGPVEEPNPLQPFGAGEARGVVGPWVASTPTRTVAALMPQTTSAPPTAAEPSTGAEEQTQNPAVKEQILSLKQMLEEKGVNDEDILSKLAALEKLQETPEVPQTLSHRTINQLQKAEKVYESTLKQIQELDKQWAVFIEYIRNKHTEQAALYKSKRQQLVEKNKETIVKMKELNVEIQKAAVKREVIEIPEGIYTKNPILEPSMWT